VTGSGNRIESNHVTNNDRGIDVDGAYNYVADNTVRGNTDNYDIAPGNQLNILLCEVPETIDWPASVKFAGTLVCTSTTTNGITVNADDVTIDMDGHALVGPGAFSQNGIYQSPARRNLRVHNGKAVQWRGSLTNGVGVFAHGRNNQLDHIQVVSNDFGIYTGYGAVISACSAYQNSALGIYAGPGSTISDCSVYNNSWGGINAAGGNTISGCAAYNNSGVGIYAGPGSRISDCSANQNSANGIHATGSSTISGCAARDNTWDGIYAGDGSTISDCSAYQNLSNGIHATGGNTISGCSAESNTGDGILAGDGSTISGCTTRSNMVNGISAASASMISGCTASLNRGDGIRAVSDVKIIGNTCDDNGNGGHGAGIHVIYHDNHIDSNHVTDNDYGISVLVAHNLIVRNRVRGNGTNYVIATGNVVGAILSPTVSGAISGSAGGGGWGSTDPWANFAL
jgi:parallel beta-helix repeat protein